MLQIGCTRVAESALLGENESLLVSVAMICPGLLPSCIAAFCCCGSGKMGLGLAGLISGL